MMGDSNERPEAGKKIGKVYNFSGLLTVVMVRILTEMQTVKATRSQIEMRKMMETQAFAYSFCLHGSKEVAGIVPMS